MSAEPISSARIFLSYRRDDVPDGVKRIAIQLRERFGRTAVFMDISSIAAGQKWREELDRALDACEAILIVIGPNWLRQESDDESLTLDDEDDLVRKEIATALGRAISVIPVLSDDAEFPPSDVLPQDIGEMTEYQAFTIRREHVESDIHQLLGRVQAQIRLFATLGRRLGAFVIDMLPALAITWAFGWPLWAFWLLMVAYHCLLVGATGRTFGKLVMGTRVESSQPAMVRWIFALARPLLGYPILLSGIGAVQLVLHPQHVAIHDRLFRGNVVQVRRRPVATSLQRIDGVSYYFDEWLLKFVMRVGFGFIILWAESFFGVDRLVHWVTKASDRLLRSKSSKYDVPTGAETQPASASVQTMSNAPSVAANIAAGGAVPSAAAGAGIAATGSLLAAVPQLLVGLVLATASVTIYDGVAPTSLSLFGSSTLAVAEPGQILPNNAKKAVRGCRAFFAGTLISDVADGENTSEAFVIDQYSEYVGSGDYHNNEEAFPKSIATSFDGIAIDEGTRVEIFSEKDFSGERLLDITGPAIINNSLWAATFPELETKDFKTELQRIFPQAVRQWSSSDMNVWSEGSLKITCEK